jgi:nucleoid-associated protein YgaU
MLTAVLLIFGVLSQIGNEENWQKILPYFREPQTAAENSPTTTRATTPRSPTETQTLLHAREKLLVKIGAVPNPDAAPPPVMHPEKERTANGAPRGANASSTDTTTRDELLAAPRPALPPPLAPVAMTATLENDAATGEHYYRVRDGDTLYGLAQKFYGAGNEWHRLSEANHLGAAPRLVVGQRLRVPPRSGAATAQLAPRSAP